MGKFEMNRTVKVLPLALALALGATSAHALGLGALEVKSQLNQPLVAEIPLIGVGSGELDALSVRLASPEAFDRVGLPRPAGVTANLQFSVGRNARGEPVVRVTTSNRVDDPFVAFLLEADWGRGSVVREFTALIDPPHIAAATVTPMTAPTVAATPVPAPVRPLPAPEPAPAPEPEPAAPAIVDRAEAEPAAPEPLAPGPEPAPAPPQPVAVQPEPPPQPEPIPLPVPPPAPIQAAAPPSPAVPLATPGSHEVVAGDTLWAIASANQQGTSIAQMMLAIQRANPDAFMRENINLLRKGAVLRIPTGNEAQGLARAEAEAQVREQMVAWRGALPMPAPTPAPGDVPTAALPPAATAQAPVRPSSPAAAGTRTGGHLEIAPPAGAGAAGAQSGAASGGAGSELRAELQQAREDLSARDAELRELRSRLAEQEALANEQERLLQLKNSQLSALEETLRQQRAAEAAATPADAAAAAAAPAADPAVSAADGSAPEEAVTPPAVPAVAEAPMAAPDASAAAAAPESASAPAGGGEWYRDPMVLGGGGLVLVGGLVALLLRRRKSEPKAAIPTLAAAAGSRSRLSDDAEFLSNLPAPAAEPADFAEPATHADEPFSEAKAVADPLTAVPGSPEPATAVGGEAMVLRELAQNIEAAPGDLDAHVALLRQHYNTGNVDAFLAGAERMRDHVTKPGDPRWREVVVMGMGLVPGHALFREVQWNPVSSIDVRTRPMPTPPVEAEPAPPSAPAADTFSERETAERPAFDLPPPDEAGLDDTRLELAKAYIEIGDTDGARGMLQEVLAEGSESARAEAARLLKQIG